ncbi:hypothetical protein Ciccas_009131, partial [Cichlidogyrus casuarinus]
EANANFKVEVEELKKQLKEARISHRTEMKHLKKQVKELEQERDSLKSMNSHVLNEFGLNAPLYCGLRAGGMGNVTSGDLCKKDVSLRPELNKEGEQFVEYVHPVQRILDRRGPRNDELLRMRALTAESGFAVPLKLAMERKILCDLTPRLPGIHGEHPLLAQIEGRLDDFGFEDFLNTAEFMEEMQDPHFLMESKLGLVKHSTNIKALS